MATHNNLIGSLNQAGLTRNEASVYLALLKSGRTNVGPIVSSTKLHRQLVYQALAKLSDLRLVCESQRNGRKVFQALSPNLLQKMMDSKARTVEQIIPLLTKLQGVRDKRVEVTILHDREGLIENLNAMIDSAARSDRKMRILSGAGAEIFWAILGDYETKYLSRCEDARLKKYLIAGSDYPARLRKRIFSSRRNQIKTLSHNFVSPSSTRITKDMLAIEIYAPEPMVIQLRSEIVANSYIDHFEALWEHLSE